MAKIDDLFVNQRYNKVIIETLGVGDGFKKFHQMVKRKYKIKYVKIDCDLETCFERVKERSDENHIAVSDENVKKYNHIAKKGQSEFDWDLELDNSRKMQASQIVKVFGCLLL